MYHVICPNVLGIRPFGLVCVPGVPMGPTAHVLLRAYVGKRQNDWDERLGMVEFVYNNSVHSSFGYTPFYLCYGRHPVSPINLVSQVVSKNEVADAFLRQLEEDVAQALQNL